MSRPLEPLESISRTPIEKAETPGARTALLEAYKKHVEELRRIEDRQNQTIALILGIFSAAATLLTKTGFPHSYPIVVYLSVMALIIGGIGFHAIDELHDLRVAARDLLVRCEIGLGFYEIGAFLKEGMLYTNYELAYRTRGEWMRQYRWIVVMVCGVFIFLLWSEFFFKS